MIFYYDSLILIFVYFKNDLDFLWKKKKERKKKEKRKKKKEKRKKKKEKRKKKKKRKERKLSATELI